MSQFSTKMEHEKVYHIEIGMKLHRRSVGEEVDK